jgi:hemolysin activation/secretion protein
VIVQNVSGDVPFYELALVQTSFKWQEGLGGAGTMRGVPGNRFVGKGLGLSNTELRWRAAEFSLRGTPSSLTVLGFWDAGRVWDDRLRLSELASDLHHSAGGGLRLGRGPNFVVAFDVGHSTESSLSMYFGLGFLF